MSFTRASLVVGRLTARLAAAPKAANAALLVRCLASRAEVVPAKKGKKATDLVSVLDRELAYEREDTTIESNLKDLAESLGEWQINDADGSARMSLTKTFGPQSVRLDIDCTPVPSGEEAPADEEGEEGQDNENEEEGPQEMDGYRLLVTVTDPAKDTVLQAGCMVTDHLRIHRITLLPSGAAVDANRVFATNLDDQALYAGPNFDELDQALQAAFYEYLEARGVDDSLAERLGDYAAAKEQREYTRWLNAAKAFAAK